MRCAYVFHTGRAGGIVRGMSLAVPSKLSNVVAPWLALFLAGACLACDPNFSPDWHPVPSPDAAEPQGDAAQEPTDASASEAGVLPEEDAGEDAETHVRLYECMIPPLCADGGAPSCANKCFASTRDVFCVVVEEPCPYIGYTEVECKLCNGPPIK
jgi:hypothetical protein